MDIKETINLGGVITLDNLSDLSGSDISLITGKLREDLLLASLPQEQIIDIGWYPEFDKNAAFRISLI